MKIILVNKYYYLRGGVERHFFDLKKLLEDNGHEVIPFSMKDMKNESSQYDKYFVDAVETGHVSFGWSALKTAFRSIYSFQAKDRFIDLLDEVNPDIIHVHGFLHHLSPSILTVAKARHIPVVMTAHDYQLIAPNRLLFDLFSQKQGLEQRALSLASGEAGQICSHTKSDRYFQAVIHKCVKNSYTASLLSWFEMNFHKIMGYYDLIDVVIAPSKFVADKFVEYGFDARKIKIVPHFIDARSIEPRFEPGDFATFIGRLSPEKGIEVLLRAAKLLPDIRFRIVGSGLEEAALKKLNLELRNQNVEFVGEKSGLGLAQEYANARCIILPSICYETFGLALLEAHAHGKPTIASRIGALPAITRDDFNGLLFETGDHSTLAFAINKLFENPELAELMGRRGRDMVLEEYNPEKFYKKLVSIYNSLVIK